MIREPMIFAGTSDISGKVRGKAFPHDALDKRSIRGIGWTLTNVQITCFDTIAESPYGALGDLILIPHRDTHAHVEFGDGSCPVNPMLGNIVSLENEPWECCTRSILISALARLDSIIALTVPSDISYLRLTPHRWSAACNNLGFSDREAPVRICPVTAVDQESIARQYKFEFRAAGATESPYLAPAAIVHAGAQGIEQQLSSPKPTEEDLSVLDDNLLADRGYARLPQTLVKVLKQLAVNETVTGWFPGQFPQTHHDHKRSELEYLRDLDSEARCQACERVH